MTDKYSASSYSASSLFALLGGMTLQDWALFVGIVFTILTFAVNTYYKHKSLKLQERGNESVGEITTGPFSEGD